MLNISIEDALEKILEGLPLPAFCQWFEQANAAAATLLHAPLPQDPERSRRIAHALARQLWARVPVPFNRWRPRGLPQTERNSPCHCGSGRKYKHCCAEFERMPFELDAHSLLALSVEHAGPHWLEGDQLRKVPPEALGHAAMQWNEAGQTGRTIAILQPLFASAVGLDGRHETALDALAEAMLEEGQETQRRTLLERMAQHPDRSLATAARGRLASILADQGDFTAAWACFEKARRADAANPQLWHLELTLLLAEGRDDEARLRAPLLAAQARRAGHDDLAELLMQLGTEGLRSLRAGLQTRALDLTEQQWIDLLQTLPATLDAAALAALYKVSFHEEPHEGQACTVARIEPAPALVQLEQRWDRLAAVEKPALTFLQADAVVLLGNLPKTLAFLRQEPTAWLSAQVLDDLLLAALALHDAGEHPDVLQAARRLAAHAVGLLEALVGPAQCHWAEMRHRPWLRGLAIAVELAIRDGDDSTACALMQQGLNLNPHDNHGWRSELAPLLLERDAPAQALALLERYPDDLPPSEHLRALCLFSLGEREQAAAVLGPTHQEYPLFLKALLPEVMDPPEPDEGPGLRVGGEEAAWMFRLNTRHLWVRSGALDWVRALALPEPKTAHESKTKTKTKAIRPAAKAQRKSLPMPLDPKAPHVPLTSPLKPVHEKRLRKTCSHFERLQGFLQALAWSPQLSAPSVWVHPALALLDRMPRSRSEEAASKALNEVLQALMAYYNHHNAQVFNAAAGTEVPLADVASLTAADGPEVMDWAAGFVQGCELAQAGWARAGHRVGGVTGPMGVLASLAARAPRLEGLAPPASDDGRPHLQALDIDAPVLAQAQLLAALRELWPVVARSRQQGMNA